MTVRQFGKGPAADSARFRMPIWKSFWQKQRCYHLRGVNGVCDMGVVGKDTIIEMQGEF